MPHSVFPVLSMSHATRPASALRLSGDEVRKGSAQDRRSCTSPWLAAGLLIALVVTAAGCATTPLAGEGAKTPMGMTEVVYTDAARERTLVCQVYYPAEEGAATEEETHAKVFDLLVARDAPVKDPVAQHPLVVISHGSGGTHVDLNWLARPLVERGYILIAPVHPGSTFGDRDPQKTLEVWQRPKDLRFVLDQFLQDPTWGSRIDDSRIGAMGYSLGGYSVLALSGVRYDFTRARAHCESPQRDPTCDYSAGVDKSGIDYTKSGESFREDRIKAILAFAPAVGSGASPKSFPSDARVHIVGSRQDALTTFDVHAQQWHDLFAAAGSTVTMTVVEEADHFVYLPVCNGLGAFAGSLGFAEACLDVTGADREAVHQRLMPVGVDFFENALAQGEAVAANGGKSDHRGEGGS